MSLTPQHPPPGTHIIGLVSVSNEKSANYITFHISEKELCAVAVPLNSEILKLKFRSSSYISQLSMLPVLRFLSEYEYEGMR